MRYRTVLLVSSLVAGGTAPLAAQVPSWVTEILTAARLPVVANEARQEGIDNSAVASVIEAMKRARVTAAEATVILDSTRAAHRDNGPVGNFGAFVQSQLDAGKRGTALAAAIRAEHARLGRGRAGGANRGQGNSRGGNEARGNAPGRGNDANPSRGRSGSNRPPGDSAGRGTGNRGRGRPPLSQS